MKLTLGDLVMAQPALQRLAQLPLSAAASFKVAKTLQKLEEELRLYEQQRVALVQRFGEEKEDGMTTVTPDNMPEFVREHQALLDVSIELSVEPLHPDILSDVSITPADLMLMAWLFSEARRAKREGAR